MAKQRRVPKKKPEVKLAVKNWGGNQGKAPRKKTRTVVRASNAPLSAAETDELKGLLTPKDECKPRAGRENQPGLHSKKLRDRYNIDQMAVALNMSGLNVDFEIKFLMKMMLRGNYSAYRDLKTLRNVVLEHGNKGKGRPPIVAGASDEVADEQARVGQINGGFPGEAGAHPEHAAPVDEVDGDPVRAGSNRTKWG